jgi:hypothetical protein
MMIQFDSIVQNVSGSWTFTWLSDGSPFYRVVFSGVELDQTTNLTYTWSGQGFGSFPPPLEIASGNLPVLSERFSPLMLIQWYGDPTCDYYLVQQYINSAWTTISTIQEVGYFLYQFGSPVLQDMTTYLYQVLAVDSVSGQSIAQQFQRYVVCPPTSPDGKINIGYSNPDIVITLG